MPLSQDDKNSRVSQYFGKMFIGADLNKPRDNAQILAFASCKNCQGSGKSLYLQGNYATGKTYALAALYMQALDLYRFVKVFTAKTLAEFMREEDLHNNLTAAIRKIVKDYEVIIIDDLDKTKWTESFDSNFFSFVDEVYKSQKKLYLSANKSLKELVEINGFNGATVRRIQDMSEIVRF